MQKEKIDLNPFLNWLKGEIQFNNAEFLELKHFYDLSLEDTEKLLKALEEENI